MFSFNVGDKVSIVRKGFKSGGEPAEITGVQLHANLGIPMFVVSFNGHCSILATFEGIATTLWGGDWEIIPVDQAEPEDWEILQEDDSAIA